jgi:hypothetical protein
MTNKTKALALAKEHGIDIDNFTTTKNGEVFGNLDLVLPDKYKTDDMTGTTLTASGETTTEFWGCVLEDLTYLTIVIDDMKGN